MAKSNNNALAAAIVFAALSISGSIIFFATQSGGMMNDDEFQEKVLEGIESYVNGATEQATADLAKDQPFMGEEDAPVTIVEFSDYRCGFCQKFFRETFPTLKENYIDTGKVKFVYRDFLLGYEGDYEAALTAECARDQGGDEAFFAMHDYIFDNISSGYDMSVYTDYAEDLGLDGEELQECIVAEKFGDEVLADGELGRALGVTGTPGFFVNDQFVSGAQPYEYFSSLIDSML